MHPEQQQINILLVDDNLNNLLALETILQAPERNLVRAVSGDDALRYLLDSDVAVILLDVHMPGINGLETAALIRGRERSKNTPIIFLTADNKGNELVSRGYSSGAVDYIQKPLDPEILQSKVAVFVELFKKTEEVKRQARLLHEKNIALESANLRRLAMLVELGQQLAAERDPDLLIDRFCSAARNIVGSKYAAVGLLGVDGVRVEKLFACELESRDALRIDSATLQGMLDHVLPSNRKPVRIGVSDKYDLPSNLVSPDDRFESVLLAPILASTRKYGWLCLADKLENGDFSEADERLAVTLTSQVAVAYENALLYSEAQRHAAELQQEVAERIQAEQERARLLVLEQQARAEAESANRTKDEFLATLSHELRTPLTAILGWSHLLRSGKLPAQSAESALETIERNAKSQSQLIDDLLDVSRIVTGKLRLEGCPLEIGPVIDAALRSIEPAANAKNITLSSSLGDASWMVHGDPTRLQQVVWNLLSNAVKFTPNGGSVDVSLKCNDLELYIFVKDTGQGIEPEFLPHVFDRFRQADGTTTRAHGGLGLGLAIVRHLVELHGGDICAESEGEGKGALFTIKLPVIQSDVMAYLDARVEDAPATAKMHGANSLEGVTVLLVDDDGDTREMVAAVLTGCGATVQSCASAAEGIEAWERLKPDVIVSDIGMPNEDGFSFIRRLRAMSDSSEPLAPAIALTAYASSEDSKRTLAAGFQIHVPKPLEPDQLVTAVAILVGRGAEKVVSRQ
jgi:signal transduction histidine kinase/DNA-binding response OmpR family regulator